MVSSIATCQNSVIRIPLLHRLIRRGMIESITVPQTKPGAGKVVMRRRSPDLRIPTSWNHKYMPKILDSVGELERKKTSFYCGFDPTSDSLHLGHLTLLSLMLQLAQAGYKVIVLVGSATAKIGDPSGRVTMRPKLAYDIIQDNSKHLEQQIQNIFMKFAKKHNINTDNFMVTNNKLWWNGLSVEEFTHTIAPHFKLTDMLDRITVKNRLKETGGEAAQIFFREFVYQTFQAYDWFNLHKKFGCAVQIGGHDQIGNIEDGYAFIWRRLNQRPQLAGVTVPLLLTHGGVKLGKSVGNALWLNPDKTKPHELQAYITALDEINVRALCSRLTLLPMEQIQELSKENLISNIIEEISDWLY